MSVRMCVWVWVCCAVGLCRLAHRSLSRSGTTTTLNPWNKRFLTPITLWRQSWRWWQRRILTTSTNGVSDGPLAGGSGCPYDTRRLSRTLKIHFVGCPLLSVRRVALGRYTGGKKPSIYQTIIKIMDIGYLWRSEVELVGLSLFPSQTTTTLLFTTTYKSIVPERCNCVQCCRPPDYYGIYGAKP